VVEATDVIAIDTNLLIYAHRSGCEEHKAARRAIEEASRDPNGWGLALASAVEFWSVVTHRASLGGPSKASQARGFLEALMEAGAGLWMPRAGFWERFARLAEDLHIQGPRIFDLQIALTAFDNGASEIWTHDRHFMGFPGIRVHDPL
jgi:uncharacterized protein